MDEILSLKTYGKRRITIDEARELYSIGHKHCNDCDTVKPHNQFHKNARKWDGLQQTCKQCMQVRNKISRDKGSHISKKSLDYYIKGEPTEQEIIDMPMKVVRRLPVEKRVEFLKVKIYNNELYKQVNPSGRTLN